MRLLLTFRKKLPAGRSVILSISSALLLIAAFPALELWMLAGVALIPLFVAIESEKESFLKSFLLGWVFGTLFFFGSCWWLTFAPITYAGFPWLIAYFLLFCVTGVAGFYFAVFGGIFALLLKRFGYWTVLFAPVLWTATEFLRFWTTGNNWNSIGYSQAFSFLNYYASFGGVFFVGFCVVLVNAFFSWYGGFVKRKMGAEFSRSPFRNLINTIKNNKWKEVFVDSPDGWFLPLHILAPLAFISFLGIVAVVLPNYQRLPDEPFSARSATHVIAIQPNIPMSGLTQANWMSLRQKHAELAERVIENPDFSNSSQRQAELDSGPNSVKSRKRFYEELAVESFRNGKKIVIFPESPMNFQYDLDPEFRSFIRDFAIRNNVSVLFNSAEPDRRRKYGFFNSAIMVNEEGEKVIQYDKIHLLPFGEFVPLPEFLAKFVPTMVGRFSPGEEYDLLPFGDLKAGVMICFESHFPSLSREYVRKGADVLVEMTNDGYLGNTPVLRQHLASAVFRAVETNRPVLRATNVGITAYINQLGEVHDAADVYTRASRVWTVSKASDKHTIYVRFGDWFAWLCSIVSLALLFLCFWQRAGKNKMLMIFSLYLFSIFQVV